MFDIAWTELGVIAVVALVVIGPKDLPKVLRTVGTWTAKARGLAREFQQGLDDIVRESELQELKKTAEEAVKFTDLEAQVKNAIDPGGEIEKSIKSAADLGNLNIDPLAPPSEAAPAAGDEQKTVAADPPRPSGA